MNHVSAEVWIFAVGVVFGAGGAWAVFQRLRKDVNGIGGILRRDRWNRTLEEMVQRDNREDRQRLFEALKER